MSPVPNFVTGTVLLVLSAVLITVYIIMGRFDSIAYLRRNYIKENIVTRCKAIQVNLKEIILDLQKKVPEAPPEEIVSKY